MLSGGNLRSNFQVRNFFDLLSHLWPNVLKMEKTFGTNGAEEQKPLNFQALTSSTFMLQFHPSHVTRRGTCLTDTPSAPDRPRMDDFRSSSADEIGIF